MDKLIKEINKVVCLQMDLNAFMKEILSVMDKRQEEHYMSIYALREDMERLKDYLGIELEGNKVIKKKFVKK